MNPNKQKTLNKRDSFGDLECYSVFNTFKCLKNNSMNCDNKYIFFWLKKELMGNGN